MHHLRKFNELKNTTYKSAAEKLDKLGHKSRNLRMLIHSMRQEYKEYGKMPLVYKIRNEDYEYDEYNGDFFMGLRFKDIQLLDNLLFIIFENYHIPATNLEEDIFLKYHSARGSIFGLFSEDVKLVYNIVDGSISHDFELAFEYDYTLEDICDDIKKININTLYYET
jgi:hypothetical protein